MQFLTGNAGKARIFAATIDNLFAIVLTIVAISALNTTNAVIGATVASATYLSYFLIFEATWSRTPGKYLQGLVVRNADGTRCSFGAVLIRTLLRVLEVNPILLGALPAGLFVLLSSRKQRFGDILANTLVISSRDQK